MSKRYKLFTALLFLLPAFVTQAQILKENYEFTGTLGSGDYAPFWHQSNRQGVVGYKDNSTYARIGLAGEHTFSNKEIGLDWGADLVVGDNLTSRVFIQQGYIDFSWKRINLSLGQKERWGEFYNPRLSTGSLVEGGNARPIPQVRIELPDYWNIPGTGGWLGIKGHIAYGWFTDENWQKEFAADSTVRSVGVRYHSKAGFLRVGNREEFPLTAEFGLKMVTQFAGTCYNSLNKFGNNHHNPARPKDYWTAFFPSNGDSKYDGSDQANIAGNVLGSWLGALTWQSDKWNLCGYYEHTFNDHSQMFWEYGLWTEQLVGLSLELKEFNWVSGVTVEYFNLKNQSGPVYHDSTNEIPDQISCVDNNYNHGRYPGWFNYGRLIATPLVSSPVYNKDHILISYNNRVEAFHFGIEGSPLSWLGYRLLYTKSNNWGTYDYPFKDIKVNRSGLVELTFTPEIMRNWSITTSFAFDCGDLYGDNYGGMITLTRKNIFDLENILD